MKKQQTGTARIEKIHSVNGHNSCEDSKWDTYPTWKFYPACIVRVTAIGFYHWGPLLKNGEEFSGIARVKIQESEIFDDYERDIASSDAQNFGLLRPKLGENYQERAEEYISAIKTKLEKNGLRIDRIEYTDKGRKDLNRKTRYLSEKPPQWVIDGIRKGLFQRPKLEDLKL